MRRLYKALAVLGMLLCLTLGAFALSFAAQDSSFAWPRLMVELHRFPGGDVPQLTQHVLRFGLRSETGEVPCPTRPHLEAVRFSGTDLAEPVPEPLVTRIDAAKVSLQILELVLLL
jgi:hypothetical protein